MSASSKDPMLAISMASAGDIVPDNEVAPEGVIQPGQMLVWLLAAVVIVLLFALLWKVVA